MSMSIAVLKRRIDTMLALVEQVKNAVFRLPYRVVKIDGTSEQVTYETPYRESFRGISFKEYVNFNPDEDGIDP